MNIIYTPDMVEQKIRAFFNIEEPLECGDLILQAMAKYLNTNYITLELLLECIERDRRIIDRTPDNRSVHIYYSPTFDRRKIWLRLAKKRILAGKKDISLYELHNRVSILEKSVGSLLQLHYEELEWASQRQSMK